MFDVILFILGFVSLSFFMPIIYFVLLHKGAFEDDRETWRWYTHWTWLIASGVSFFICGLVVLLSGGARNSFVLGCIVGLLVPLLYWTVYLRLPVGRIEMNKIRIEKIRNILKEMYYSNLSESQRAEVKKLEDFVKTAKATNDDILIRRCNKEMDKIIGSNETLRKKDVRYMNNAECFAYLRDEI